MSYSVVSNSRYLALRKKYDKRDSALKKYFSATGRNYVDKESERAYNIPKGITNKQTSNIEVYEFKNRNNHGKYMAYMSGDRKRVTTWTGDTLGQISYLGNEYSTGLGKRQNFRVKGIDGKNWSGTFFVSSGDYVIMKVVK